jgi:dTDP-4-amino-4,6-dideoxygalactose transaminase
MPHAPGGTGLTHLVGLACGIRDKLEAGDLCAHVWSIRRSARTGAWRMQKRAKPAAIVEVLRMDVQCTASFREVELHANRKQAPCHNKQGYAACERARTHICTLPSFPAVTKRRS